MKKYQKKAQRIKNYLIQISNLNIYKYINININIMKKLRLNLRRRRFLGEESKIPEKIAFRYLT